MKLKKWLMLTYIIVMLIPIITGVFVYKSIENYNKNIEIADYIRIISLTQKYKKELENPKIYLNAQKSILPLDDEDKNSVNVNLYNKYGMKIFSTANEDLIYYVNTEDFYKNLNIVQKGYRANTIKKPVLKNGELVGFYELIVSKDKFVKSINNITAIGIVVYVLVLITVFLTVIHLLNKKLTTPISILVDGMVAYGRGEENLSINYKGNDEIGDLINHFKSMKDEIDKNKKEIIKQQKDKEYLIAAISHDLKTPLTSIRAYAEALKEYENLKVNDINNYTSIIINKSDYMKNMLDDLLTYTLLTTQYNLDLVNVDGEEFSEMLFSGYDGLCSANEINLVKEIKVSGSYNVDVKSMIRVMDNLVSNALRYVEKGGSIYLGAYSEEDSLPLWLGEDIIEELKDLIKGNILIFVKNDGNSIPEYEQEKIFKAFYQGDDSRNKKSQSGTGLGLSIVQIIIEKHEGNIKVISKEGFGTMFCCIIKNSERK